MERQKDIKNINSSSSPITLAMTPSERVHFLANLIIDHIIEDQRNGTLILRKAAQK